MSIKSAISRDEKSFGVIYTYRELTYKLAHVRFDTLADADDVVFEQLKAEAKEPPLDERPLEEMVKNLGLVGYELSKVETFVIPETLNTVVRGIAKRGDDREILFYVERP